MGIKDMIARCIQRMRQGACATCDNRSVCPAGRWQQMFGAPGGETKSSAKLFQFLSDLTARRPQPRCFRSEVETVIEPMLASREVSIDRVAHELGMSRQTLYRRLRSEGVTFEALLDAKRRQLAMRYVRFERMPVKVAAYELGFSDPAAFSRAFKRWTGSSPSQFRAA